MSDPGEYEGDVSFMEEHLCDEIAWSGMLLEEFTDICHAHNIEMAVPIIRISDSKTALWTLGAGFKDHFHFRGHLIESYPWYVVLEVLKHEMAHQYVFPGHASARRPRA